MTDGMEKFKEKFAGFEEMYALIGGTACDLLMEDAGLDFRRTKDFDIVLIIEAINEDYGKAFWKFIEEGGYSIKERSDGSPVFYRFQNPSDASYPKEIELFSRKSSVLDHSSDSRLTPIHISEDLSSLSAILLDEEYYSFLKSGLALIDGVHVLNYTHIIPFKAKAWLDLTQRKNNGEGIDSKKIDKHKRDIFRLSQLITGNDNVELPEEIYSDMTRFIDSMATEVVDLKSMKIQSSKTAIIETLKRVYSI